MRLKYLHKNLKFFKTLKCICIFVIYSILINGWTHINFNELCKLKTYLVENLCIISTRAILERELGHITPFMSFQS